ncbi:hypothetical protein RFI_14900 [Reticulomyxa filosa]|uniref:Uncharacterized protein n=1 Tax=Reticulomyxa filosa TaxID=46433 RepID=X6N966_RETFI|nr:hypothetical protein RFI_14900 [Reticulomyxa filosa]|eukprot:ETO22299.1 hypothetical protein RFI_14900 [Reticulomyxa filosa]
MSKEVSFEQSHSNRVPTKKEVEEEKTEMMTEAGKKQDVAPSTMTEKEEEEEEEERSEKNEMDHLNLSNSAMEVPQKKESLGKVVASIKVEKDEAAEATHLNQGVVSPEAYFNTAQNDSTRSNSLPTYTNTNVNGHNGGVGNVKGHLYKMHSGSSIVTASEATSIHSCWNK